LLLRLLLCDLRTRIGTFLLVAAVGLPGAIIWGIGFGPAAALPLWAVLLAWGHCMRIAGDDDKAEVWPFLRVLPVPARVTVGVQYASCVVAVVFYVLITTAEILIASLVYPHPLPPYSLGSTVAISLSAGILLVALFNALYFRLGYRNAQPAMQVLLFALMLVPIKLKVGGQPFFKWVSDVAAQADRVFGHPVLLYLTVVLAVAALTTLSWAYSVSAFRRREFR